MPATRVATRVKVDRLERERGERERGRGEGEGEGERGEGDSAGRLGLATRLGDSA